MFMKQKILILSLSLVVCLGAEAQTAKAGPELHEVKEAVMHLDSVVTALHGWKAGTLPQGSLEESRKIWQTFRESVYEGGIQACPRFILWRKRGRGKECGELFAGLDVFVPALPFLF